MLSFLQWVPVLNVHTAISTELTTDVIYVTFAIHLSFTTSGINMAASPTTCTKGQHAVIQFLWTEDTRGAEIHQRLSVQYGANVLLQESLYERIYVFRIGKQVSLMENSHGPYSH
jgi:hypothetical protein